MVRTNGPRVDITQVRCPICLRMHDFDACSGCIRDLLEDVAQIDKLNRIELEILRRRMLRVGGLPTPLSYPAWEAVMARLEPDMVVNFQLFMLAQVQEEKTLALEQGREPQFREILRIPPPPSEHSFVHGQGRQAVPTAAYCAVGSQPHPIVPQGFVPVDLGLEIETDQGVLPIALTNVRPRHTSTLRDVQAASDKAPGPPPPVQEGAPVVEMEADFGTKAFVSGPSKSNPSTLPRK